MDQKKIYEVVNFVTLGLAGVFFLVFYEDGTDILKSPAVVILIVTAILVHFIKALRLYIAFYGRGLSFGEYIIQYCKVIPVSMILPLKLGDLFRAYCYGYKIRNYFAGALILLMDRFVDSLALVTVVLLMNITVGCEITVVFYVVLVFLLFVILCYQLFPEMYLYWKKYFLLAKASGRRNGILRYLERLNVVYQEVAELVKSRGVALYMLSFFSWAIEIGGLLLSNWLILHQQIKGIAAEYLKAALTGRQSEYLKQFVMINMILLFTVYLMFTCLEYREKGRGKDHL